MRWRRRRGTPKGELEGDDLATPAERALFAHLASRLIRCHAHGCEAESDVLLHLATGPDRYADLCLPHAREAAEQAAALVLTCDCAFCVRARRTVLNVGP